MLQRIQSIYLLLASIALFALFLFPFAHNVYVDGKPITLSVTGVYQDVGGKLTHTQTFTLLTIGTVIIALIPLVLIFLFRSRKQQVAYCWGFIVALLAYSFWVSEVAKKVMGVVTIDTHNWGIGLFMSSISILFIIMAIKAIQRDEKLVRSADRLR